MPRTDLVQRLAAFPTLSALPPEELEWLAGCGTLRAFEAGAVLTRKGEPLEHLYVVLSGNIPIHRDLGSGPRLVMDWIPGDVTGLLPYSRASQSRVDVRVGGRTELFTVHASRLPEMIQKCPAFTTHVVHVMLDRARRFNTSDLEEEKAISLGKLAAGLAHELNNPASATVRSAKLLMAGLPDADAAARALGGAAFGEGQLEALERLLGASLGGRNHPSRSPLEQADHEDRLAEWLEGHGADSLHAAALAATGLELAQLDELAGRLGGEALDAALRWIAARSTLHALASDIGQTAARIHQLVEAVKRFTYMDNLGAAAAVDVEEGIRDTLEVISSRTRAKGAAVHLDLEAGLPRVRAAGSDLNQVWLELIDNALDAIAQNGRVEITARSEGDRVVVRVVDDGAGIPPEILPRIFDPFFTTKPPGQGVGLGLQITRRLLRGHRGDVTAESRPGRTEFRVSLEAVAPA